MEKSSIFIKLAFILIFLDSLFVYFGKQYFGVILPVNLTIPVFLILTLITRGQKHLLPEAKTIITLLFTMFGFLAGIIILPEFGISRLFEIISATMAFLVGYTYIKHAEDSDDVSKTLLLIGLAYSLTCMIALSYLLPSLFPVTNKLWSLNGTLINRPEVTTDQNFQILYLIPGLLVLAMPVKKWRLMLTIICFIGSLYALARLQTRSGILVCFSVATMCIFAPIWTKSLGRGKTFVFPIASIIAAAVLFPLILDYAHEIILRFTKTDFSTGLGRLHSLLYLFENIYKPTWWIPHGNADMIALTGNKPHSNPTGVFLDGGLLALTGWFLLFITPLYRLSRKFFKRQLDNLTTMLLIGGVAFMIVQLSLNVPLMDQVWLIAGVIAGAEARLRLKPKQPKDPVNQDQINSPDSESEYQRRYPKLRT